MRKKYVFIFLILALFFLSSCDLFKDESKIKFNEVEELLELSFGEDGIHSLIIDDIDLPDSLKDVSLKWTSNKPEYLTNDGKVYRGNEDVEITLSVELEYDGKTRNVTFKVTVKGVEETKETYTITFVDEEGTILDIQLIEYGLIPSYNGITPTKESTAEFNYTFIGWSPELKAVDGNQEYVAVFEENVNKYTITFVDEKGTILETQLIEYGLIPSYNGITPTKESTAEFNYTFIGWSPELKAVDGNQEYVAVFEERIRYPEHYVLANDSDFEGNSDGEFIYIGDDDYVIIPEYIKGIQVTKTSNNNVKLLSKRKDIKGIAFEVPKNITDMSYLFYDHQLDQIDLSFLDTSNVTNMKGMFYNSQATTLDLSNFDTSNVTDMSYMFYGSEATTLDLSSFDTSNVTDMSWMFSGSQATTLDLSNFDTSNVTNMGYMFYDSQATTLDLSSFDTKNVTDMSGMFYNTQATTLDLSNFDTSNVTDMSGMFCGSKATTLDLSNFDTSNVTTMRGMFYNTQATTLDLSNFDTSNVTNMGGMFYNSQATTIDLSNFDTSNVTNMGFMFYGSQATTLDVSSFDTKNVTDMSWMFYGSQATTLDLSNFDTKNVTDMNGMFYNTQATTLDLSSFDTKNVTDMSGMFYNTQATTLDLSNFDTSNVTNMGGMFYNSQATTLDLSNFDTSNVTNMSYMFYGSQATTLDVSSFDTSNVTNMGYMFYGSQATTLDVSSFDTSNVTDMSWMFGSSQSTTLDLSNFDTSNVTNMGFMFYGSQATTLDLSSFDTSNVTNMSGMFCGSKATTLDLSNFDTSNVTNMGYMFGSSQATTLDLSSFDTSNVTNMSGMFYGSKATTLDLSNFDTSNVTNMSGMFDGSKATTIDLSNFDTSNVTNMSGMFYGSKATTLDLSNFDTSNVTDMSWMFSGSQATTLDLSSFDTSNVTDMSRMFYGSQATTLDLSSFDTSNVTDMRYMFYGSQATTLDLSSFDTSNVTDMSYMFFNTQATTGYGKTQADVDRFNASSGKPLALVFIVKQPYTITFDSKGGSSIASITKEEGTAITKPVDPTKDGYTFLGWFEDEITNDEFIFSTMPNKNITLYAKWTLYLRDGIYIYFGEYPQTIKEDNVVISTQQDSRGYFLGSDGAYYAKVVASPYGSNYYFSDGKSVINGGIYYFKVELIKWRILNESSGEALILCESIIANKRYDDSSNNYKNSEIRAWLNDQFYDTAFTNLQKQLVITTEVDNSVYSTGDNPNHNVCENTFDKVFLLSYREVTNSSYGFSSDSSASDTARQKVTSDYSRATGAYTTTSSSYYGNGLWWLRSPYSDYSDYARRLSCAGYVYHYYVHYTDSDVVPALKIKLN